MNYNYSNISTKDNCIYINDLKISNFSLMPKWYEIRCYLNGKGDIMHEKHLICFEGVTENDPVFSLWKGHSPK